jgi:hypothetical protein
VLADQASWKDPVGSYRLSASRTAPPLGGNSFPHDLWKPAATDPPGPRGFTVRRKLTYSAECVDSSEVLCLLVDLAAKKHPTTLAYGFTGQLRKRLRPLPLTFRSSLSSTPR